MTIRRTGLKLFLLGLAATLWTLQPAKAADALVPALVPAYPEPQNRAVFPLRESSLPSPADAWRKQWVVSTAALLASQSLDAASSYGLRELNPVLAGPDGQFGARALAIKFGITGGLIGVEYLVVRRFPRSAKYFTVLNWTTAGATAGVAIHNYRLAGR